MMAVTADRLNIHPLYPKKPISGGKGYLNAPLATGYNHGLIPGRGTGPDESTTCGIAVPTIYIRFIPINFPMSLVSIFHHLRLISYPA